VDFASRRPSLNHHWSLSSKKKQMNMLLAYMTRLILLLPELTSSEAGSRLMEVVNGQQQLQMAGLRLNGTTRPRLVSSGTPRKQRKKTQQQQSQSSQLLIRQQQQGSSSSMATANDDRIPHHLQEERPASRRCIPINETLRKHLIKVFY
jgi:hypothetical protein